MADSTGLRRRLEAWAAHGAYGALSALPVDAASGLMGGLMRRVGPRLGVTKVARRNLALAFPEKTAEEREALIGPMWENLGRCLGEFPHLGRPGFFAERCELVGAETITAMRDDGRGCLFFGAHTGNWEVVSFAAEAHGLAVHRVYRSANNPLVEDLYRRGRSGVAGEMLPKGRQSARRMLDLLKRGEHVAIMMDQKLNEGLAVPFFGHDAMTPAALGQFALRLDLPVVPTRAVRLSGARFRVEILPPLRVERTGDHAADVLRLTAQVTSVIETWVREHPEQWLWVHCRWPREAWDAAPPGAA